MRLFSIYFVPHRTVSFFGFVLAKFFGKHLQLCFSNLLYGLPHTVYQCRVNFDDFWCLLESLVLFQKIKKKRQLVAQPVPGIFLYKLVSLRPMWSKYFLTTWWRSLELKRNTESLKVRIDSLVASYISKQTSFYLIGICSSTYQSNTFQKWFLHRIISIIFRY